MTLFIGIPPLARGSTGLKKGLWPGGRHKQFLRSIRWPLPAWYCDACHTNGGAHHVIPDTTILDLSRVRCVTWKRGLRETVSFITCSRAVAGEQCKGEVERDDYHVSSGEDAAH